jgi:hypothetical protein
MKKNQIWACMVLCGLALGINSGYAASDSAKKQEPAKEPAAVQNDKSWQETFEVDKANLGRNGENKYFILRHGYILTYKKGEDTLVITVTNKTKEIDGVKTRVVEERETVKGSLAEVSQNYFAIDKTNKAVYYFGEDVDIYKDGQITGHEGAWLSGENGAKFGLMMPAEPKVGDKYYQEVAPGIAMDRAETISLTEKVTVPAGTFENCLVTKESSDLEKGAGKKQYAPGIGLVTDGGFELVSIIKPEPKAGKKDASTTENSKSKTDKPAGENTKKITDEKNG